MSGTRAERRAAARTPTLANRYGTRRQRRALGPAAGGILVLLGGLLLVGQDSYLFIRFGVSIFALITAVFVWQSRQWAWLPVPLVVAVLWNPVLPFGFTGPPFRLGHLVAALALLVTGVFARYTPRDE
ncbi:DUF6804 family protein [Amnibacterium sp.]|uniref:DUF6804 family protein n=1 Tax=Amnibacterium sp. TaxID=1872496 RepID=UPI00260D1482|nr:DUF6804 family protein [Amnibacterium sp.]MCU1474737.1 hypothetical protein [Amnibacterium sp.]